MIKFIKELYRDLTTTNTGKFSHTKFWSNIAYCAATFIIIKLTYQKELTENYFAIYLGVVASHASISKWISTPKEASKNE